MISLPVIKQRYVYLLILFITAIMLLEAIKTLFFFDEDVFVIGSGGIFIKKPWERSVIVKLTFIADNFFRGNNPLGYHYTNLILHLINAVLALLVLKELLKLVANHVDEFQQIAISYIFFILFLITPVHSEPLCYILARGGSIVSLFSLFSILLFLKSNFTNRLFHFLSLLSFLFALFSYEISWTVPLILLCVIIFEAYLNQQPLRKKLPAIIPYFLVFAAWFVIKIIIINKLAISDYKNESLFSKSIVTLFKNNAALFFRNFIPPFESTVIFSGICIIVIVMLLFGCYKLYKRNKPVFYFVLLLIAATQLAFAATVILGIDTHDSESERYIYFSSAFALMVAAILITVVFNRKVVMLLITVCLIIAYTYSLFNTIGHYKAASGFSKKYLNAINTKINNGDSVFFVNMPTQYRGALMFRAMSRMSNNTNANVNIMQEYISYLYGKKSTCVLLSGKESSVVPDSIFMYQKPLDSIAVYFPEVIIDNTKGEIGTTGKRFFPFSKQKTIVIALKNNALYIFDSRVGN
jgi:hypothetical protein